MLCSRGPRFMLCPRGPRYMLCPRGPRFMLCPRGPRFMLCPRGPRFMLCPRGPRFMLCPRGPRFRMSQRAANPLRQSLWRNGQLHPPSGVNPNPRYINLHPLRPHTSIPRPTIRPDTSLPRVLTPTPAHTQTGYASSSPVVGAWRMERMLQALCVDSQAGFYFTRYCERSGNPLWENAVHCWCDLQQYHQLFYQDGLDPYRVQRQAHHAVAQACRPRPPPLEVARSPAMWSAVPERYRGYRLGSLLGHRTELQHFTSFLQDNTASIHLACWQDI
uniref:RGS domain-containing protein n=1 Tax=Oncorhynchus tshawytscha TaxID=74940 RepID=A0AAZ3RYJ6_ONCTS